MLTLERAKELLDTTTTEPHLILHAKNVMVAMGGLAKHFGEDVAHWQAVGYLHDYDYEQHPEEQPESFDLCDDEEEGFGDITL